MGGGTGYNIECFHRYVDVATIFSDVYLIDLTPSLCEEAQKRFDRLGWRNVHVDCADAATWQVPARHRGPSSKVMLITFSYSLSMMPLPTVYQVVDLVPQRLAPGGILGIVDFLAEDARTFSYSLPLEGDSQSSYKSSTRYIFYFARLFWQWWFELDGVHLHPCRRDYVLHMMNRSPGVFRILEIVNGRNKWAGIPFIQIPYYILVGVATIQEAKVENIEADFIPISGYS